jgi:hypothetical protein
MIRSGKIDSPILGALGASAHGYIANWMIPGRMIEGIGAMYLVQAREGSSSSRSTLPRTEPPRSSRSARCRAPASASSTPSSRIRRSWMAPTRASGWGSACRGGTEAQVRAAPDPDLITDVV